MYKVFYNDKAIIILDRSENLPENVSVENVESEHEMHRFLDEYFRANKMHDVVLSGNTISKLFHYFASWFDYIEAAGGLVKNRVGKCLFIKRWGIWDLPKGKIEKNESYENAAIREVEEETGVGGLKIEGKLPDTYHVYQTDKQFVLKRTCWFLMLTEDGSTLKPQQDEGITEVVWFNNEQGRKALSASFRSLRETMMAIL